MDEGKPKKENSLFKLGTEFIGGGVGGVVGFALGGPAGAIIGGTATPLITEFSKRLLTSRQKAKVGAALIYAQKTIQHNLDRGLTPNTEFFKDKNNDGRPDANEIWEGILINAEKEYEERKIPYYGNLMANLAFEKNFSKERAGFLLKLSRNLSYRQLCLIAIFTGTQIKPKLRKVDYRGDAASISQHLASILHEILEMYNLGIVNLPNDSILGLTDVNPSSMTVQGAGVELERLMELNKISAEDLQQVAVALT